MASSIVESPIASGGRPCFGRFLARTYWTPPQPASALAAGRTSRAAAPRASSSTGGGGRLTRRRILVPRTDALPHRPVRDLLPAGAGALVAPDAAADPLEAVHPGRELHLLRVRELEVLPAPGRGHARQPGGGEADRSHGRRARAQVDHGRGGRARPGRARRLQVLRLLRTGRGRRARCGPPRAADPAAHDRAARRRELLHVPGDLVHGRRLPPPDPARLDARRRDLPELLLAPGGRADRPRARVPAAARVAARPHARGGRARGDADRSRPREEGGAGRLPGALDRRPGVRCAAAVRDARRAARLVLVRRADLLRLLGLHGHCDRARSAARLRLPGELRPALSLARLPRVLAPLAHDAVPLPARLPLHPARRQPRRAAEAVPQPYGHAGALRALAR